MYIYLELSLLFCIFQPVFSIQYINVNHSDSIIGSNHIDFYLSSYSVAVGGNRQAYKTFDRRYIKLLRGSIVKESNQPGPPRGIPPYNWVKFRDEAGNVLGLFSYKTINFCQKEAMPESKLFDYLNLNVLRQRFNDNPDFFMSRTMLGHPLNIHSLTTDAIELYYVHKSYSNFTYLQGAHSDVRVIPFVQNCRSFQSSKTLREAKYVFTGSVNHHNFHELQFLSLLNSNFEVIFNKILIDPDNPNRPQKNWLPFWDGCRLLFSKRYGPEHIVGEFSSWRTNDVQVPVHDTIKTLSPAYVPSEYMIRGSAPVIAYSWFEDGYVLGCVHLRGKLKVYRHSLYVMELKYPYTILSYSPLFAFKPYREIEFVMSLNARSDGSLELTHGSMDCEPRLAIFPMSKLQEIFPEYFKSVF